MGVADSIILSSGRNATLSSTADVDWFRFTAPETGMYRFDMSNILYGNDYDMQLYNSSGTLIDSSTNGADLFETIFTNLQVNNTYYLRIYSYRGYSTTAKYYVTVTNDACALLEIYRRCLERSLWGGF